MSTKHIKTVALLVGGWSAEREVSLEKGAAVEAALRMAGYDVRVIDVTKDLPKLVEALTPKPDAVFNNLYGRGGEDGTVQAVLNMLGIPYTHSGVLASAIGMDKPAAKKMAESVGVRVPSGKVMTRSQALKAKEIPYPFVMKPANEGSSVGVEIVRAGHSERSASEGEESQEIRSPRERCSLAQDDSLVLVEDYVAGKELTVAVLDGKAQAVTEIISNVSFFDYEAKYKSHDTQYVLPADLPRSIYNEALRAAEAVYNVVGCRGLARCDFRFDPDKGGQGLYFLEINTMPGCTAQSIGPSQVAYNGMDFVSLCKHLVETATCDA